MSEIHVAMATQKARELVEVVLEEFDRWAKHEPDQQAGENPHDSKKAAAAALYSVRTDLEDHLGIPIGITLASWGLYEQ